MEGRSELTKTQEPLEVHLHRPPEATSRHPCQPPACDTRPRVLRNERGLASLDAWTSTSCQTVTHFCPPFTHLLALSGSPGGGAVCGRTVVWWPCGSALGTPALCPVLLRRGPGTATLHLR